MPRRRPIPHCAECGMTLRIARSCRWLAGRLHSIASVLNQRAYRIEHGLEGIAIGPSPLRRLQAEIRQSILDRELDPAKSPQGGIAVDGREVDGKRAEDVAHQVDGHPFADASSIEDHICSSFKKFLDQRRALDASQALGSRS